METNKKSCSRCNTELPFTIEYFARKCSKTNKLEGICKKCRSKSRREHYRLNKEKSLIQDRLRKIKTREWFYDIKSKLQCENCGENRHWVLDFHHKDPKEKEATISFLMQGNRKTKLLKEIEKCIVLCANCHRDLHFQDDSLGKNQRNE